MNYFLDKQKESCTGCEACYNICPTSAIRMEFDEEGFKYPFIYENKCIECKKCQVVCPMTKDKKEFVGEPECYAIWADDDTRYKSSSGGVFTVAARKVLGNGGLVCGAAYDEDMTVKHIIIDDIKDLHRLQKSKYVQTSIDYIYSDIKKLLEVGRKILFVACPCQVAGLKSFLGRETENLVLMDLLCHCSAPPNLIKEYFKDEIQEKIINIDFRNKHLGWSCAHLIVETEAKTYDYKFDNFFKTFNTGILRRPSCEDCHFAEVPRQGDLTIGDFWRIEEYNKELNDNKGTSMVLVNNEKGKLFLEEIEDEFTLKKSIPFSFAQRRNRFFSKVQPNKLRERFYKLKKKMPVRKAIVGVLEKKYDIALIGNWSGYNYGAHLTHYALYKFLTNLNYDVLMVEKPNTNPYPPTDTPRLFEYNPYPEYDLSPIYNDLCDMKDLNLKCDTFIVGSDQLWNYRLFGHSLEFYALAFADDSKRKISYATSFGNAYYEGNEISKKKLGFLLNRFDAVSVREKDGVDICENEFNVVAKHVLDPVFLCDKNEYIELAKKSKLDIKEEFMFCYILSPDSNKMRLIKHIAKTKNLKIICIGDAYFNSQYMNWKIELETNTYVEDWLYLIINAKYVFADSFHATAFSIIFNKNFFTLNIKWAPERCISILSMFDIKERYISNAFLESIDCEKEDFFYNELDYIKINKILDTLIKDNKGWLIDSLNTNKSEKEFTFWDAYKDEILSNKKQMADIKSELARTRYFIWEISKKNSVSRYGENSNKFLKKEIKKMNVVVFGAGSCYTTRVNMLKNKFDVFAFTDNDKKKWGTVFQGKNCISPNELIHIDDVLVVIAIGDAAAAFTVVNQLLDMGIYSFEYIDNWVKILNDN